LDSQKEEQSPCTSPFGTIPCDSKINSPLPETFFREKDTPAGDFFSYKGRTESIS
jgi:hypothetical protein